MGAFLRLLHFTPSHALKVPRLVADLNSTLGREVSISEAKAWVHALDRLGQGLDREKLLEACLVRQKGRSIPRPVWEKKLRVCFGCFTICSEMVRPLIEVM